MGTPPILLEKYPRCIPQKTDENAKNVQVFKFTYKKEFKMRWTNTPFVSYFQYINWYFGNTLQ